MRTLRFLLRKEFLQIFRDRLMVAQMFLVPLVQLMILANAATFEVRTARVWVLDQDVTTSSRGLVERLVASGRFAVAGASASRAQADDALLAREANAIVALPAGFERDLVRTGTAPVQLVLNAEDGAAAGITGSYARSIVDAYAAELAPRLRGLRAPDAPVRGVPRLVVQSRGWYNAEGNYRDYMVPGILVELLTIVGTLLTAINIAREKEIGTLDQLNVTPVTRAEFIAAKLLPLWCIAMVELALGLVVARWLFDVPMRGSIALVFALAGVYLLAVLGVGLWISTMVETQQQAMFVTFFVIMVYLLMSGLFTPLRSMPAWAQWMAQLNPVMHFVAIMRAILLRGAGLAEVLRPAAVLAASAAVMFALAVRQYAKRAA